jgi:hypothetical protein
MALRLRGFEVCLEDVDVDVALDLRQDEDAVAVNGGDG